MKKSEILEAKSATVGEIAAKDSRKADVFKKLGIDFCCGGKKSLQEASMEAGITREDLEALLAEAEENAAAGVNHNFGSWDLGFLSDYINQVHHQYVKEHGPIIEELADKVATRHGSSDPRLIQLSARVHQLMNDLYSHLEQEEQHLFPAIKQQNTLASRPDAGEMSKIIERMELDHEDAGEELRNLRKITQDYSLPEGACNSYRYLFDKLKAFENDLFQHIHLENNILFPKAALMGKN